MIDGIETTPSNPTGNISTARLLKKYDRQINTIGKQQFFRTAEMRLTEFLEQATALREKLATTEFPAGGNILVVTCLPFGSLVQRLRKIHCGQNVGVCDCKLNELKTAYPPKTLYVLVGVDDGRERRLNGEAVACRPETILALVEPRHSLDAWKGADMVLNYPSILHQQGLLLGKTSINGAATALWIRHGEPVFGSTRGASFRRCSSIKWAVPSYQELVTL